MGTLPNDGAAKMPRRPIHMDIALGRDFHKTLASLRVPGDTARPCDRSKREGPQIVVP